MRVIEDIGITSTVDYAKLDTGDCFRYGGQIFIKNALKQQATRLTDGHVYGDMCGDQVTPVNAEVHVIN